MERVESTTTWKELDAVGVPCAELLAIASRLREGAGTLMALFVGSDRTVRILAAAALAREAGRDLYLIDMRAVVSKYIGETEKNLDRIFARAEPADDVLFFDEADALFGRGDISEETRDRYANIDVDSLAQRFERFEGLVILATNYDEKLQNAFLRRDSYVVEFPRREG